MSRSRQSRQPPGLHPSLPLPRLYDRVLEAVRVLHYRRRTEQAYTHGVRRFLQFHHFRHPRQQREGEVGDFLSHLAVYEHVAASTQNQALSAPPLQTHLLDSGCAYGTNPFPEFEGTTVRQIIARWEDRLPDVLRPLDTILSDSEGVDSAWRRAFDKPEASDLGKKMVELVAEAERDWLRK